MVLLSPMAWFPVNVLPLIVMVPPPAPPPNPPALIAPPWPWVPEVPVPTAVLPENSEFVIVTALGGGGGKPNVPGLTWIAPPSGEAWGARENGRVRFVVDELARSDRDPDLRIRPDCTPGRRLTPESPEVRSWCRLRSRGTCCRLPTSSRTYWGTRKHWC